ncbi:Excinuclease ABC subunit C [Candidatus Methanoperedens nitroreducens]|uniref:UvrABC system protein C n=1 Tax=Candidatus Methanoperedens nitratireducens TaxID=1392998 RepID=A0A062V678_9EURY|nr:excinuclease ABC subunit UvrC [Candidatus Methanoperedens nitroreducens]KCZ72817.1 Excinuclease ABC subunit C [Candidatus Methanoperedens nitroreducens]MDJ1423253.1 excinuclease ABC subunit UvrC [Candidatus Methanoperedens sp.]
MTKNIKDAKKLPDSPGVYLMRDKDDRVIYVGKAASLKDRVSQYFREQESPKTRILARNIENFEYIVTENEVEALVLESNLIKEHRPRYNVRLRDDKQYPYIKITGEEYPRICIARRREQDGAQYFGPYPSSKAVREVIKMASGFGIRRCKKKLPCPPCLNYHIKQCAAPCIDSVTKEEYLDIIKNVVQFLKGSRSQLIPSLTEQMNKLSEKQEYERAARVRDLINALQELSEKQRVSIADQKQQDVLAIAAMSTTASIQIFHVSEGKLKGRDTFSVNTAGADEIEVLSSFIKQYYQDVRPPEEIVVPIELEDESISIWLSDKNSRLKTPEESTEIGLMNLARENVMLILTQNRLQESKNITDALYELQKALALPVLPEVIEAFDISNIGGTDATGSLVVFENGEPDKNNYRKFRVRTNQGANDFAMMVEVVARAYVRRREEKKRMPDLILIDGGKGQLNAALAALHGLGLSLNIAALAKEFEHIFLPEREAPVILPGDSPALQLLQKIRDEAHRFALRYHKKLREKRLRESELDEIKGIGEKKKRALLQYFGSVQELRKAGVSDIEKVVGVTRKDAERVYAHFNKV